MALQSTNRRCSTCKKKVPAGDAIIGSLRAFCGYDCLKAYTQSDRGQKAVRALKRQDIKQKKDKLKTKSDYTKEAQAAFNAYVRLRDAHKPCISCGNPLEHQSVGGGYDAGHFRSRGSAAHLKYHLLNCHAQCKKCNRYLSGNVSEYRIGLIKRIGLARVEDLESDNKPRKMDVEYLKRLTSIFRKRLRILEKIRNKKCCNNS